MIPKSIEKALNEQIATEAGASFLYLAMASWCDMKGFDGTAAFLYKHSAEERMHMLKLFHYINNMGGHAIAPEIKKTKTDYKTVSEIFDVLYKSEQKVTKSVSELVELCIKERDYSTHNFIQWYVAEQYEEEVLFRGIMDKINLVGEDGKGLFMFDQYMQGLANAKAGAAAADADTAE
ncbi:MAG: ferritin [Flavobacteriales bacterium]